MTEDQRDNILLTLSEKMSILTDKVEENTKKIDIIGNKVEENTKKIDIIGNKVEENTKKIDIIGNKVEENSKKIDIIGNKVEKNSKKISNLEIKVDENIRKISSLERTLVTRIDGNAIEQSNELIRQRKNMAKMQQELSDKIEALFDVKEINSDKFKEQDEEFKSINHILDRHHRRILKLESNVS